MAPKEESSDDRASRVHLLFFRYLHTGPYTEGESRRRARASELVQGMGGSCEILRFPAAWNGFNMMSIVRGLSLAQVRELAEQINSWGAVDTTIVETSDVVRR